MTDEPCPRGTCAHPAAMHDEDCRCWMPGCECKVEYQLTFTAWYLFNIAMTLATHRQRRRRPWL